MYRIFWKIGAHCAHTQLAGEQNALLPRVGGSNRPVPSCHPYDGVGCLGDSFLRLLLCSASENNRGNFEPYPCPCRRLQKERTKLLFVLPEGEKCVFYAPLMQRVEECEVLAKMRASSVSVFVLFLFSVSYVSSRKNVKCVFPGFCIAVRFARAYDVAREKNSTHYSDEYLLYSAASTPPASCPATSEQL